MPSIKIPRKSTATDMTPFVDVAFLILSFFMLATKFKPPEPAPISTPKSVSADQLTEENAVLVEFDSTGRVFFSMSVKKPEHERLKRTLIETINTSKNLGLTEAEIRSFERNTVIGVPFRELKATLAIPPDDRYKKLPAGIPTDSTNNELAEWITTAKSTFYNESRSMQVFYMIKGDNNAVYPSFDGVVEAMRRADQFSYKLVTDPKEAPAGSELYRQRQQARGASVTP
ncbi:MAG TPA: biopolymer transporter ExbD [Flavisolibacter sp.]|nr:biopolymer transporter ExbD [Flavisolibacter sp.]